MHVMAVVRVAVMIKKNLSIFILGGGICGVGSGGSGNSCSCGSSLLHHHQHKHSNHHQQAPSLQLPSLKCSYN